MEEEEKGEETKFELDDDLPGQGQFYCTPCARHFTDQQTKATHIRSKLHKRRWDRQTAYTRLGLIFSTYMMMIMVTIVIFVVSVVFAAERG